MPFCENLGQAFLFCEKLFLNFCRQLVSKKRRYGIPDLRELASDCAGENIPIWEGLKPCTFSHRERSWYEWVQM